MIIKQRISISLLSSCEALRTTTHYTISFFAYLINCFRALGNVFSPAWWHDFECLLTCTCLVTYFQVLANIFSGAQHSRVIPRAHDTHGYGARDGLGLLLRPFGLRDGLGSLLGLSGVRYGLGSLLRASGFRDGRGSARTTCNVALS